ncbi:MAG: TIGR04076 family protein [Armatimonadetes bacterium]|nr:TIGR04076 family protein [Armatimonadota bacterium]
MDKTKLTLKVVKSKGKCMMGYKTGDCWELDSHIAVELCSHVYYLLYPWIQVLRFGGKIPWGKKENSIRIPCIDEKNMRVFEITKDES